MKRVARVHLQNIRFGILGGGQLARMMIEAGSSLGLEMRVFCQSADEPAAQICQHATYGKFDDIPALIAFAKSCDFLTFESEFIPRPSLRGLIEKAECQVYPLPQTMMALQNRASQKNILQAMNIPSADFLEIPDAGALEQVFEKWPKGFVVKKNYGGYDGFGTYFVKSRAQLRRLMQELPSSSEGYIAEKLIPFRRELACIFVRNSKGQFLSLPLVESFQKSGKCDWVKGPVHHPAFGKMAVRFKKFLKEIGYVGCMGVEFFDTGRELLVNELAPRVHNSGHYSQAALVESQFLLHLKAILGLKLAAPQLLASGFAMINLIGISNQPLAFPEDFRGQLQLYGKKQNKPGRKMGHVNFIGPASHRLLKQGLLERKRYQL